VSGFEPFDAGCMPLDGLRLIEASAGTGKTFSLAGLYLRLLLERELDVRDILVMTFTRAATQELRERIRARLALAARLAGAPERPPRDGEEAFIVDMLARLRAHRSCDDIARQLRDAAARMDEATITTIHGFSQRAAEENAFDSALPFDRGEQVDDRTLYAEVVRDYWRAQVIGQPASAAAAFVNLWQTPEALDAALAPILQKPHMRLAGPDSADIAHRVRRARGLWQRDRGAFAALLDGLARADDLLKGKPLERALARAGSIDALLAEVDAGVAGTAAGHTVVPSWFVALGDPGRHRELLKARTVKRGCRPDSIEAVAALAALQPLGRLAALRDALATIRERATARKLQRRQFSFADMIEALHQAMMDEGIGDVLASALHRRWPWALVDEFQDTDPLQYAILRRIYVGRERGGLILIGDPKQAIYGFRGGDVFAYLEAGADAQARYSLATNWRSTPALIQALEAVFDMAGDGAFVIDGIRYQSVAAGREPTVLLHDGKVVAPMTVWPLSEDEESASDARARLLAATVAQIAALLAPGAAVMRHGEAARALMPGDIAVLVNSNREAAEVQRALSRHGIAAVCMHQESVFASDEAVQMLRLLQAAATPSDEDAVRVALTTALLGCRQRDIIALLADEHAWQQEIERFQSAHERWRRAGVLAMLEPLLQAAAPRVLALEDGERRMTNYLHLGELLQQAQSESFGMAGQVDWLASAIAAPTMDETEGAEAAQLRLESDDALVRIATVHKVKGLQFGVVFLPFAAFLGAAGNPQRAPFAYHDDDGAWLDVGCGRDAEHRPRAIREARAEAVRLLYVALTRAEQACYFGWGAANTATNSALAWLLHSADGAEADVRYGLKTDWLNGANVARRLTALSQHSAGTIEIAPLPAPLAPSLRLTFPVPPVEDAQRPLPAPRRHWSLYSFSRLVRDAEVVEPRSGADDELREDAGDDRRKGGPLATLRGARFGSAVHELLETSALDAWPPPDAAALVRRSLRSNGIPVPDDSDALVDAVIELVSRALATPLPDIGALAKLPRSAIRREMAFLLKLGSMPVHAVTRRLARAGYAVALPAEQASRVLHGLMQGFIDVVVEAGGRYYLIDYKTNWLGASMRDYTPPALTDAMCRGHYELQMLIYSVALHRYLRRRLPAYDPVRHFGGVCYLFLRGMNARDATTGVYSHRPDTAVIEALDALFLGPDNA
jgi:exodeoxyribonuclease V beta subunit